MWELKRPLNVYTPAILGDTDGDGVDDLLVTEGDGISDSRMDCGDSKNWAGQIGARRHELTLKALFSEELGAVIQVPTAVRNEVMQTLRAHGLSKHSHFIGKPNDAGRCRT